MIFKPEGLNKAGQVFENQAHVFWVVYLFTTGPTLRLTKPEVPGLIPSIAENYWWIVTCTAHNLCHAVQCRTASGMEKDKTSPEQTKQSLNLDLLFWEWDWV